MATGDQKPMLTDEMIDAGFEAANANGLMNGLSATETVKVISEIYAAMQEVRIADDHRDSSRRNLAAGCRRNAAGGLIEPQSDASLDQLTYCNGP